ncbi:MAG TPA: hypothetical protein VFL93_04480, partial [Longimicrobiaceae bacterium]|nr:hypothetical protein [Longimicrobiaceae bacterium]
EPLPIIGYGPAEELASEEAVEDDAGEETAEELPLLGFEEFSAPDATDEPEEEESSAEPLPMLDAADTFEAAAPEQEADEYVDLGALVLPGSVPFDAEAAAEPAPEQDLAEILALLPDDGTGEPIDPQEAANHYDLGLAFKEMGLLNEAVTELRRALLGGANPLATLEVLGECLAVRGDPELAARLLERAIRLEGAAEEELVGVVYWLARCHAELGRDRRARSAFEWVAAVDADFRDTAERIRALGPS